MISSKLRFFKNSEYTVLLYGDVMLRNLCQVCSAFFPSVWTFCGSPCIMYEAFELCRLVEKLPLKICAIATWGELIVSRTRPRETRGKTVYTRGARQLEPLTALCR